ncbi:COMM domain-containing protein 5 isoform X2 [Lethenteron reissneri]|uniref:COMM domain-containing protein 5 isoform X2 n=1 Tax=Lethenteron reissneri TaxID=7753 RepID=UPI002AB757D9|nr:COMM domain-containing protein 5 isoform X2 [Lethenteron reissneri]
MAMAVAVEQRISFLGLKPPREVEVMVGLVRDMDASSFCLILDVVAASLEGRDCSRDVQALASSLPLSREHLSHVISGTYTILQTALRLSTLKQEMFKDDLQHLRIPEKHVAEFVNVLYGKKREALDAASLQPQRSLPQLESCRWRVDVAISTSVLARALRPSVLMQFSLTDGSTHQFEVPVSKFQELRYNVAQLLKEMSDLEKRSILRIQD